VAYRVLLIRKDGEREDRDEWASLKATPEIGEKIELRGGIRKIVARVTGIARGTVDWPSGGELADLVIAREL